MTPSGGRQWIFYLTVVLRSLAFWLVSVCSQVSALRSWYPAAKALLGYIATNVSIVTGYSPTENSPSKALFFLHNDVVKLSSDKKSAMQLCELWMLFFRFIRLKTKYIQIKWKLRLLSGLVEGVGPAKQVCLTTCIAYSFTCSLDACMGL